MKPPKNSESASSPSHPTAAPLTPIEKGLSLANDTDYVLRAIQRDILNGAPVGVSFSEHEMAAVARLRAFWAGIEKERGMR